MMGYDCMVGNTHTFTYYAVRSQPHMIANMNGGCFWLLFTIYIYGMAISRSKRCVPSANDIIAKSDIILLNFEVPEEANEAACRIAHKYGIKTILNPAPAHKCRKEYLNQFYCITPNQNEAEIIDIETTREVVTLGGDGALLIENGKKTYLHAIQTVVKDTTGAGDCFNGAFAVAISEGKSLYEAVCFSQKAAALSVTQDFVMPSLPYREQIDKMT